MTCYTCHDPHRWQPGIARRAAQQPEEGDGGNSFLRLPNAPEARLCADCHTRQAQVGKSDHDLNASAPDIENTQGQKTTQAGTCGACHLVHNGKNSYLLWARDLGAGENPAEAVCRSCHQKAGPAGGKVPGIASHPSDMTFRNIGRDLEDRPGYFPLFTLTDGKETPNGQITCLSCHNGHQWRPGGESGENRHPEEGDAGNSFLRNQSSDTICRDCHGSEALYRYLYFHDPIHRNPEPSQMRLTGP
jgi:predicted CXXCH cytochrome family protein